MTQTTVNQNETAHIYQNKFIKAFPTIFHNINAKSDQSLKVNSSFFKFPEYSEDHYFSNKNYSIGLIQNLNEFTYLGFYIIPWGNLDDNKNDIYSSECTGLEVCVVPFDLRKTEAMFNVDQLNNINYIHVFTENVFIETISPDYCLGHSNIETENFAEWCFNSVVNIYKSTTGIINYHFDKEEMLTHSLLPTLGNINNFYSRMSSLIESEYR